MPHDGTWGGANSWADSKTYYYEFKSDDFSASKLSAKLNEVTWTLNATNWKGTQGYGFDTQKGFKIGSGNQNCPKDATLSTSEIDGTITSIVINTSGNSRTTAKLDVLVGGKAFGIQQALTSTAKELSFTGSASGPIELKYSESNKPIYVKSISVTYEAAPAKPLTSLEISGEPTKTTYNVGEEFDPAGLVVTGTYDDNTTAPITDGITWTKNPKTLSIGNTSCTVTASVGGVKSEPFEVNGLKVVKTISLSIDPTTSTVVKAPVNVTLTATDGATVYYTTDGKEPTINSEKYSVPFEVTKSGTTVKALAVAEGVENVTAEATYTIEPEQPLFSEESKTFKNAFDVTISLPESTDATSKIHYAIGAKATAESPVYEKPINISAENDGDKVILHAVVVDKYGNVGKEKFCTYTKTNAIVFDFTSDWNGITATVTKNNSTDVGQVVSGKELNVEGVVMTATNKTSENQTLYTGLYTASGSQKLRVYGSVTFTAPEGYNLLEVTFTGKDTDKFNTEDKAYKNPTWTGNVHAVTFTASASVQIATATIKLVAAEPVKSTFGTLDFKATDGSLYYATFSSDKDVVFTNDVTIYGVSVEGRKVKTTQFPTDYYEVTDAIVGEGTGIVENGYYVPANTGVLVAAIKNSTSYYFPKTVQNENSPANMLKPSVAGGVFNAETGYKYYKLAYDNYEAKTGLGFYWGAENGGAFNVKAGTAYLAVPVTVAAGAKGFTLNGESTGIEGINANVENAKAIYNLNGQRIATMAKPGLYIVNGKKVVRK